MKLYKNLGAARQERLDVQALKVTIKGDEFPPEIFDFPNLEELYLEGDCKNFDLRTSVWKKLKVLSIKWPYFKGDLSSLFKLPRLENLKVIETPLTSFLLPLGHSVSPLKSLTIKDCGLNFLPEEISILSELNLMNLSGNNLKSLPHAFIDLKRLKRLNLDQNHFEVFPDLIKKMPGLSHLSIDHNLFMEEEIARIQREFHISPH